MDFVFDVVLGYREKQIVRKILSVRLWKWILYYFVLCGYIVSIY